MYIKNEHGNSLHPGYAAMVAFLKAIGKESLEQQMCNEIERLNTPWFTSGDGPYWWNYTNYLNKSVVPHKVAVYEEGMKLQKYVTNRTSKEYWEQQLIEHDLTKFSFAEQAYAWKFYGDKEVYQSGEVKGYEENSFQYAWFHHKSHNPHHPEWWHCVERNGEVTACYPMEKHYAIEMLADWSGASITYGTGLFEWLKDNIHKFKFHDETLNHIVKPLAEVYGILLIVGSREVSRL